MNEVTNTPVTRAEYEELRHAVFALYEACRLICDEGSRSYRVDEALRAAREALGEGDEPTFVPSFAPLDRRPVTITDAKHGLVQLGALPEGTYRLELTFGPEGVTEASLVRAPDEE